MRCQCIICQELFENSDDQVISALDCGHTFHNTCLNQWLENGRTCPSCRAQVNRKRIIQRLYFDAPEDIDEDVDQGKLQNEIDNLKLEVRKKEKEKNDAGKEKSKLLERVTALEEVTISLGQSLKTEQSTNSGHLKTLRYYESQQKALQIERQECRKIKQKLATLQSLDLLMNGSESDAADLISTTGEGQGAVQTLSRQVAFLKREFEKLKHEKRQFKEQFEKVQMNEMQKTQKIAGLTKQCKMLQDQLDRSESDLKIAERETDHLKKDNARLKRAVMKRGNAVSTEMLNSSLTEVLDKSIKMQIFSSQTPKLDKPEDSENIDLDETPDIFASPVAVSKSRTQEEKSKNICDTDVSNKRNKSMKRPCDNLNDDEGTTKYLKITSTSEKNSQTMKKFKSDSSIRDTNSISTLASMNIFKKRPLGESANSISRQGYDGLGGHTTHINPKGNPKATFFKKPSVKKSAPKSNKLPSLPTLHDFITID